jgi:hypothetical protein
MDCSTASSSTSSRPFKKSKTILNDIVFFEEDVRRCLTPVFPYAVLYTIEPEIHSHRCCNPLRPSAGLLEGALG